MSSFFFARHLAPNIDIGSVFAHSESTNTKSRFGIFQVEEEKMSNLLTGRLKVPPAGPKDWAQTTPVELKDRDGWPIRVGARITVRHKGYRKSGEVVETFLDWKGREVVEFSINGAGHVARPEWCRVQYRKG